MARIRTIKPEFWTDEKIVQLPLQTRLFFIGLFNFADDFGAFEDKPDQLHYQIFPGEQGFDGAAELDLLLAAELIEKGINAETGDEIFKITNFEKHQKVDRPTKSKILPNDPAAYKKAVISAAVRRAVALKYGCAPGGEKDVECYYCGVPGMIYWHKQRNGRPGSWVQFTLELDHLKAESEGGETDASNLILSCRGCNRSKGNVAFYDYLNRKFGGPRENSRVLAPERKGMEGNGVETTSLVGQDPTPPADPPQNLKPERYATETAQVIEYLNATTGRQFKGSKSDRATIAARFKEKYNLEDFKAIVDHKTAAWLHDPKQSEYLRPETLFSAKHFDSYLNAAKIPSATLKPVNGTTTTTTYTPPDPNRRKAGSW
jgi:uncharacterized phage protein (TIGR02220 family)